ncbi:MAG TPA: ABC transporter permease [Pseudonocardiaceae bacterium]|jgi:D-xylose transport system permease protein|nr:ABC transporter permease [Pseudonocardiaceae bacterium]
MTDNPTQSPEKVSAGNANSANAVISDFGIDTTSRSTKEAFGDYIAKVRGGEFGALPAIAGLIVLLIVFSGLSSFFLTVNNLANLVDQGAGETIIAMGVVFVLLLGEIDLSAGTASGVCIAVAALHLQSNGNLLSAMGGTFYYAFIIVLVVAVVISAFMRVWVGAALALVAIILLVSGFAPNPWLEMLLAICVGTGIGILTGAMVSKIRIPSFVVTLALFLAWNGVVIQLVGGQGTIPLRNSPVLNAVANGNLSVLASWILLVVAGGGYAAVVLFRHYGRLRKGLVAQPTTLVLIKVAVVVALAVVATWLLTLNRSPNPQLATINGVPYVIPVILVLMIVGTYVLDRTRYGRHIYAVGGNREAARRAGVNVDKIRMSVFVICSTLAAVGAIVYSSKIGSVSGAAGAGNELLFAVGAAVIGGTSLFGGRGRIRDAVIGGAVLATVQNGLNLLGFQAATVNIVTGFVLLVAATVDALSRRRASAR